MPKSGHTNRLISETSPYLLQHAHNPVDWYPWGQEALERAKVENKPIFLSIGYSACHWCHVMERESFEAEETASLMNQYFINIKVDREERPDIDAIYMEAVQAMTGQGGWPMSMFLLPDGQPFYGGTYFPPEQRYGMPSFQQVLQSVAQSYHTRSAEIAQQAQRLTEMLQRTMPMSEPMSDFRVAMLDEAVEILDQHFDYEDGGFGSQPKFPQPMTLDFIMDQFARTGDPDTLHMAELTLRKMALGGIYDQLGGGFARYSVDSVWLVPHFEKMLYDNAQLLRSYLHLWQLSNDSLFLRVVNESIDYVLREMTAPTGGFYSAQDADSEGVEGKFFVWVSQEIETLLEPAAVGVFETYYGVSDYGNFEGKNILNVRRTVAEVAQRFRLTETEVEEILADGRQKLFAAREERIKPARDEKILTEWNGLMIHALAECGVVLGRSDALQAAIQAAEFILAQMSQPDGKLYRTYKALADGGGKAHLNAYLEDYAAFARALISLYEATFEQRWLDEAQRLTEIMIQQFADEEQGGFYQTGIDHERLVVRRKDLIDNAIPSGNAMAAEVLLRLATFTDNPEYREQAAATIALVQGMMVNQPTGFGRMLSALASLLSPSQEVVIVGEPDDPQTQAMLAVVRSRYLPNTVLALRRPDEDSSLPLLMGREMVDGKATAYVCENHVCQLPVTDVEALVAQLTRNLHDYR